MMNLGDGFCLFLSTNSLLTLLHKGLSYGLCFTYFIYKSTLHSPCVFVNKNIRERVSIGRASKHAKHFVFNTKSLKLELNILK